jgi:hypothetical protein
MQARMEEMRGELVLAQSKVNEMEYVVRKAERNLDVSLFDQKQMDNSLAHHVEKIDALLGTARDIRHERAELILDLSGARRRFKHRAKVCGHVWLSRFFMI